MEHQNERVLVGFLFATFEQLLLGNTHAALQICGSGTKAGLRMMEMDDESPQPSQLTRMIEESLKHLDPSALDNLGE